MERLGAPLLIYRDDDVQRIAQIKEDRGALWIGRSPSADVSLPGDSEVSKLHAQVEHVGNDCTLVDDGLSRNGSFVNEERISGRRMLRDGDVIRVGRTRIRFRSPGAGADSTVISTDLAAAAGVSPAQRRVLIGSPQRLPRCAGSSFARCTQRRCGGRRGWRRLPGVPGEGPVGRDLANVAVARWCGAALG